MGLEIKCLDVGEETKVYKDQAALSSSFVDHETQVKGRDLLSSRLHELMW